MTRITRKDAAGNSIDEDVPDTYAGSSNPDSSLNVPDGFVVKRSWSFGRWIRRVVAIYALALAFKESRYRLPTGYGTDLLAMRGVEKVTNGGFDTDLTGWTAGPDPTAVTATWEAGRAKVMRGAGSNAGAFQQEFVTTAGKTYELIFTSAEASIAFQVYQSGGGSSPIGATVAGVGTFTYSFVAAGTGSLFLFWPTNNNTASFLDDISVREVLATYTRSGTKYELLSSGAIVGPFASDVPGITSDGYWSRGAVTNLVTHSSAMNNASWVGQGPGVLTVAENSVAAPDGLLTGNTITVITGTSAHRTSVTVTPSTTYTYSMFIRRGTMTDLKMSVYNATGSTDIVPTTSYFNRLHATDWTRVDFTFTTPAGCTQAFIYTHRDSAVTGTYYAWGMQCVAGTQPGPIIVTTGAAATVGADSMALSSTPPAGDFIITGRANIRDLSASGRLFQWDDGTTNNRVFLSKSSGTGYFSIAVISGGVTILTAHGESSGGGLREARWAVRYASGAWALFINGSKASTDAAATLPSGLTRFLVAIAESALAPLNGPTEFLGVRKGTFSDAALIAETA